MTRAVATVLAVVLLIVAGVVGVVSLAEAAPRPPVGTLAINETAPYVAGQTMTFTSDPGRLRGGEYARIGIVCHMIEANQPDKHTGLQAPDSEFTLPADVGRFAPCAARLTVFDGRGQWVRIAAAVDFCLSGTEPCP